MKKELSRCSSCVSETAMSSWYDTVGLAKTICNFHVDPPPPIEPEPDSCVDPNYYDPHADCNIGEAIKCVVMLDKEIFNPKGTENRFCS